MTNHMIAAAVLLLLALVLGVPPMIRSARNPDLSARVITYSVGDQQESVVSFNTIIGPLQPAVAGVRQINPFSLKIDTSSGNFSALPLPPPPPLRMPEPPVLPLPHRSR